MNVRDALRTAKLSSNEMEMLLSFVLGKARTWILMNPGHALSMPEEKRLQTLQDRRLRHEPMAYIIGEKEFYGRMFFVDTAVLIPRPATESVVELALEMIRGGAGDCREADTDIVAWGTWFKKEKVETIVDVGTGSGCIAVMLACKQLDLNIIATDVSQDALSIAQKNAERHGVRDRIDFRQGDLLDPVSDLNSPFLLVSNPPYIPDGTKLKADVSQFEPHGALFAGAQGTKVLGALLKQAEVHPYCCGFTLECRQEQANRSY